MEVIIVNANKEQAIIDWIGKQTIEAVEKYLTINYHHYGNKA